MCCDTGALHAASRARLRLPRDLSDHFASSKFCALPIACQQHVRWPRRPRCCSASRRPSLSHSRRRPPLGSKPPKLRKGYYRPGSLPTACGSPLSSSRAPAPRSPSTPRSARSTGSSATTGAVSVLLRLCSCLFTPNLSLTPACTRCCQARRRCGARPSR